MVNLLLTGDCSHVKTLKTNLKEDNNNLKPFTASVREMFNNLGIQASIQAPIAVMEKEDEEESLHFPFPRPF